MGLVDYSDSDGSDVEASPAPRSTTHINTTKPTFQKVVDRSNPGKIKVSLPQTTPRGATHEDTEPPTKRAKVGGGGFSGFNSFLPAPKRTGAAAASTSNTGNGSVVKKTGLGNGVSLKTAAAPGFSRESGIELELDVGDLAKEDADVENGHEIGMTKISSPNLPPNTEQFPEQKPADQVKLVGKPLMFKPLSVARKPAKKKKLTTPSDGSSATTNLSTPPLLSQASQAPEENLPKKPKVSLFSISSDEVTARASSSTGDYQPVMYSNTVEQGDQAGGEEEGSLPDERSYEDVPASTNYVPTLPGPDRQSLDAIAGDLHLSAAERRQLFGRHGKGSAISATKVINFNTDQEYLHNEELRATGQQVAHNPVKSIAPGKHSLRQLVNAAQSQREALEESFAKGKANRAEASNRYGW